MKRTWSVLLVVVGLAVASHPVWAVDAVTQHGKSSPVQGTVTGTSKTEVTVRTGTGAAVAVPANEVVQIKWEGEPPILNIARIDESAGRLQKALDTYTSVLGELKGGQEQLKQDVEYFIVRAKAKMALADPAQLDEAIQNLEQFRSQYGDTYHFYPSLALLGELYLAKRDFVKARAAFDGLGKSPFKEDQMAAQIALARQNLLEERIDEARAAFEAVAQQTASTPAEKSKVQEAKLGLAECLQLQKSYDQAIPILEAVIAEAAADDTRVQAAAYVRQGDCLQAAGKPKEALLAYLHVDLLFPSEKILHAESLYHLTNLWNAVQQPGRAAEAADRLVSEYPNSPWARRLQAPGTE